MLSVVTGSLIKVISLLASHHEVVAHSAEGSVAQETLECLRLIRDELDMETAFCIDLTGLLQECLNHIRRKGSVLVSSDRVS